MKTVLIKTATEIDGLASILVAAGKFPTMASAKRAIRQGAVKIQVAKTDQFAVFTPVGV